MANPVKDSDVRIRLQRLAKGTLFVGIAGGYTLLLSLTLILAGWRPALLAAFLVVLSQFFRHIANDIDRIGWTMSNQANASAQPEVDVESNTRRYQTRMLWLVFALAQLANVALVGQAYVLADGVWVLATAVALLAIESFYALIRHVNRQTAFEQASYGFRDKGVFSGGPEPIDGAQTTKVAKVERKLARLRELQIDGQISERAYDKACDKYRVRLVMEQETP